LNGGKLKQLATGISEFQIVVRVKQDLRKVCKFVFSKSDASVYLIPYAAGGSYYFGGASIPEQKASCTFDFKQQESSDKAPKVSIHESGQVHVRIGRQKAGPLTISHLSQMAGEHVASVSVDSFEALPLLGEHPKTTGSSIDQIVGVPDAVASGRFAIYMNGASPTFKVRQADLMIRVTRPSLATPLYVGIAVLGQDPIASPECRHGVTIICGWNGSNPTDFLYLRGE
jgi:hypothetical protein